MSHIILPQSTAVATVSFAVHFRTATIQWWCLLIWKTDRYQQQSGSYLCQLCLVAL